MKKIINIALLSAVVAGSAVTAQAADTYIHMYGASAQRDYWTLLGPDFMTTATSAGGLGCATGKVATYYSNPNVSTTKDKNKFVVRGTACQGAGNGNVYITYNAVASNDGIRAAQEGTPINTDTCSAQGLQYRTTVDYTTCDAAFSKCSGLTCSDITLGTSDVEGSTFNQESHGHQYGHVSINEDLEDWQDIVLTPENTGGMNLYKPTIVPFAFYANNDLSLTNLTRPQAVNLFGGIITRWGQFIEYTNNPAYHNKGVQLCFRHAGSGTHATLEKAVMRGDMDLVMDEANVGVVGDFYEAYFYTSSGSTKAHQAGMKECIQTNGGHGIGGDYIAVGYMDADAAGDSTLHQMTLDGVAPSNVSINNGTYTFWSAQNVYVKTADDTGVVPVMMAYAKTHVPTAYANIWSKASDVKVEKNTDTSLITFPAVDAL